MATLAEISTQYPQYSDMSDADLAGALHAKFYSDMPVEEFNQKVGLTAAPSEVPSPRVQPPPFAKDYPGLYSAAQTTRQMLGPTLEAGGAIGGAILGAPFGPAGVVAGSALGYGTTAGALRQADIALGNVPEMTPMEGISAGTRDLLWQTQEQ
jgi:hypothetical protein